MYILYVRVGLYKCVKSIQVKLKCTMHVQFFDIQYSRMIVCIYTSTHGRRACNESTACSIYIIIYRSAQLMTYVL